MKIRLQNNVSFSRKNTVYEYNNNNYKNEPHANKEEKSDIGIDFTASNAENESSWIQSPMSPDKPMVIIYTLKTDSLHNSFILINMTIIKFWQI